MNKCIHIFLIIGISSIGFSQMNVTFLGNLNQYPAIGYNDIWGYVDGNGIEYALLGCIHGTSIVRVDNPAFPTEVAFITGPSSTWRDIKTHSHYAYIVTEGTSTGRGLQIVDLSQLPNTATLVNTIETWFTRAHNIYIDDGYAYVIGTNNGGGMHILNLSNPTNPSQEVYYTAGGYIHDVYVWNDTVVTCNGSSQVYQLLNVTNKSAPQLISTSSSLPGIYSHSGWMTEDKRYFFGCEEFNVRDITVWDLIDKTSWDLVIPTWQISGSPIIHNLFIDGNFAHISYYTAGYVVLDISDPTNPQLAGQYDTYPASNSDIYDGAWGCYPFLPSGKILVSDISTGLYILDFQEPVSTFQTNVSVNDGWNMVSAPGLHPTNQNVDTWWAFRDPSSDVFRFNGSYQSITSVTPGEGYWMKHIGARTYNTGDEWPAGGIVIVPHDPIAAVTGWNLVGGYDKVVPVGSITTTPPGLINSVIYHYDNGYLQPSQIEPGYSYWIKLSAPGFINIGGPLAKEAAQNVSGVKEDWGRIIIRDATGKSFTLYAADSKTDLNYFEMPPMPPAGSFDVRYSSNRMAEDINSSVQTIDMTAVEYPVTVSVENMSIRLMDETGKAVNENIEDGKQVVISDSRISKLKVSSELIPTVYALEQNYPNPFNPSTTIEFSLPEDVSSVKLTVYNSLGERVAELVNGSLTAGRYSYKWDASDVATGMYIYELRTDNFVSIKKMVLIR
jgi:choice-of-anchor B domain-containing protein